LPPTLLAALAALVVGAGATAAVLTVGHEDPAPSDGSGQTTTTTTTVTTGPDRTAPKVIVTRPRNGAVFDVGQRVTAAFACTDAGGGGLTCRGTVGRHQPIDTSEGRHEFKVVARDGAGNVTTKRTSYTATVPTTEKAPATITITSPEDGATYDAGTRILAQYSCEHATQCLGDVALNVPVNRRPGKHPFSVSAIGTDGKAVKRTVNYTVKPAIAPLTATITSPQETNYDAPVVVSFACAGGTAPLMCDGELDGQRIDSGASVACGSSHTLTVTATDAAAKKATASRTFTMTHDCFTDG
jgi:hypothetical protein